MQHGAPRDRLHTEKPHVSVCAVPVVLQPRALARLNVADAGSSEIEGAYVLIVSRSPAIVASYYAPPSDATPCCQFRLKVKSFLTSTEKRKSLVLTSK